MWEVSQVVGVEVGGRRPVAWLCPFIFTPNKSACRFIMLHVRTLHYKYLLVYCLLLSQAGAEIFLSILFVSSQKSPEAAFFLLSFIQVETQY